MIRTTYENTVFFQEYKITKSIPKNFPLCFAQYITH